MTVAVSGTTARTIRAEELLAARWRPEKTQEPVRRNPAELWTGRVTMSTRNQKTKPETSFLTTCSYPTYQSIWLLPLRLSSSLNPVDEMIYSRPARKWFEKRRRLTAVSDIPSAPMR